jgi:serine/threonine-protein kinase
MSVAFEVDDLETEETLELQHFPAGLFESDEQADEFADSLRAWTQFYTPAIVSVREVLSVGEAGLVLLTDSPKGEPLRTRLEVEPVMQPKLAVALARELLTALAVLHEYGLVHGDIKPNTIFVAGRGAKLSSQLVDGGITSALWMAKDLGDKTALIGTPYYAPAEQFGGESPDVRSDLYNVATVLFELIAGRLPWVGRNFLEVFQAKISTHVTSLRGSARGVEISDELERAVTSGIQADPDKRFQSAEEFLAAIEGAA